jgi:hypothetical protein
MENDYININEKLPEKGIDIIGIDEYGDKKDYENTKQQISNKNSTNKG